MKATDGWRKTDVRISRMNDVMASIDLYGGLWYDGFVTKATIIGKTLGQIITMYESGKCFYPARIDRNNCSTTETEKFDSFSKERLRTITKEIADMDYARSDVYGRGK